MDVDMVVEQSLDVEDWTAKMLAKMTDFEKQKPEKFDNKSKISELTDLWTNFRATLTTGGGGGRTEECFYRLMKYTAYFILYPGCVSSIDKELNRKLVESIQAAGRELALLEFANCAKLCSKVDVICSDPWGKGYAAFALLLDSTDMKAIEEVWDLEGIVFLDTRLEIMSNASRLAPQVIRGAQGAFRVLLEKGRTQSSDHSHEFDPFNFAKGLYMEYILAFWRFWHAAWVDKNIKWIKEVDTRILDGVPSSIMLEAVKLIEADVNVNSSLSIRLFPRLRKNLTKDVFRSMMFSLVEGLLFDKKCQTEDVAAVKSMIEVWLKTFLEKDDDEEDRVKGAAVYKKKHEVDLLGRIRKHASEHFYTLAEAILNTFGPSSCLDFYLGDITILINTIAKAQEKDEDQDSMKEVTRANEDLYNKLLQLAKLFKNEQTRFELKVGAFSRYPTRQLFDQIFNSGTEEDGASNKFDFSPELIEEAESFANKVRWGPLRDTTVKGDRIKVRAQCIKQLANANVLLEQKKLDHLHIEFSKYEHHRNNFTFDKDDRYIRPDQYNALQEKKRQRKLNYRQKAVKAALGHKGVRRSGTTNGIPHSMLNFSFSSVPTSHRLETSPKQKSKTVSQLDKVKQFANFHKAVDHRCDPAKCKVREAYEKKYLNPPEPLPGEYSWIPYVETALPSAPIPDGSKPAKRKTTRRPPTSYVPVDTPQSHTQTEAQLLTKFKRNASVDQANLASYFSHDDNPPTSGRAIRNQISKRKDVMPQVTKDDIRTWQERMGISAEVNQCIAKTKLKQTVVIKAIDLVSPTLQQLGTEYFAKRAEAAIAKPEPEPIDNAAEETSSSGVEDSPTKEVEVKSEGEGSESGDPVKTIKIEGGTNSISKKKLPHYYKIEDLAQKKIIFRNCDKNFEVDNCKVFKYLGQANKENNGEPTLIVENILFSLGVMYEHEIPLRRIRPPPGPGRRKTGYEIERRQKIQEEAEVRMKRNLEKQTYLLPKVREMARKENREIEEATKIYLAAPHVSYVHKEKNPSSGHQQGRDVGVQNVVEGLMTRRGVSRGVSNEGPEKSDYKNYDEMAEKILCTAFEVCGPEALEASEKWLGENTLSQADLESAGVKPDIPTTSPRHRPRPTSASSTAGSSGSGKRSYQYYSDEVINQALLLMLQGKSMKVAAETFNIHRSALCKRLQVKKLRNKKGEMTIPPELMAILMKGSECNDLLKKKKRYSPDAMTNAVNDTLVRGISAKKAAETHRVPLPTLHYRIKREKAVHVIPSKTISDGSDGGPSTATDVDASKTHRSDDCVNPNHSDTSSTVSHESKVHESKASNSKSDVQVDDKKVTSLIQIGLADFIGTSVMKSKTKSYLDDQRGELIRIQDKGDDEVDNLPPFEPFEEKQEVDETIKNEDEDDEFIRQFCEPCKEPPAVPCKRRNPIAPNARLNPPSPIENRPQEPIQHPVSFPPSPPAPPSNILSISSLDEPTGRQYMKILTRPEAEIICTKPDLKPCSVLLDRNKPLTYLRNLMQTHIQNGTYLNQQEKLIGSGTPRFSKRLEQSTTQVTYKGNVVSKIPKGPAEEAAAAAAAEGSKKRKSEDPLLSPDSAGVKKLKHISPSLTPPSLAVKNARIDNQAGTIPDASFKRKKNVIVSQIEGNVNPAKKLKSSVEYDDNDSPSENSSDDDDDRDVDPDYCPKVPSEMPTVFVSDNILQIVKELSSQTSASDQVKHRKPKTTKPKHLLFNSKKGPTADPFKDIPSNSDSDVLLITLSDSDNDESILPDIPDKDDTDTTLVTPSISDEQLPAAVVIRSVPQPTDDVEPVETEKPSIEDELNDCFVNGCNNDSERNTAKTDEQIGDNTDHPPAISSLLPPMQACVPTSDTTGFSNVHTTGVGVDRKSCSSKQSRISYEDGTAVSYVSSLDSEGEDEHDQHNGNAFSEDEEQRGDSEKDKSIAKSVPDGTKESSLTKKCDIGPSSDASNSNSTDNDSEVASSLCFNEDEVKEAGVCFDFSPSPPAPLKSPLSSPPPPPSYSAVVNLPVMNPSPTHIYQGPSSSVAQEGEKAYEEITTTMEEMFKDEPPTLNSIESAHSIRHDSSDDNSPPPPPLDKYPS